VDRGSKILVIILMLYIQPCLLSAQYGPKLGYDGYIGVGVNANMGNLLKQTALGYNFGANLHVPLWKQKVFVVLTHGIDQHVFNSELKQSIGLKRSQALFVANSVMGEFIIPTIYPTRRFGVSMGYTRRTRIYESNLWNQQNMVSFPDVWAQKANIFNWNWAFYFQWKRLEQKFEFSTQYEFIHMFTKKWDGHVNGIQIKWGLAMIPRKATLPKESFHSYRTLMGFESRD
jgi:hypothetical protein